MIPSERRVEEAIDALDAAGFQQLAEAYMAIEFPERFGRPLILGRNSRGSTTSGWPDAYATLGDGRIDALEASAQVRNWTRHLDSDLRKAGLLPDPGLGGFAFISWARTPRPATLMSRQAQLVEIGVPVDRQVFVFRQQLISDLRQGRFAALWATHLGLSVSAHPFCSLREAPIYGTGASGQFMPTIEEYEDDQVSRAAAFHRVDSRLRSEGFVMVEGRGASGKTALAASLGWLRLGKGRPVYYVDLADPHAGAPEFVRAAGEALLSRGDRGVLFIADNVHQNASTARELYRLWSEGQSDTELLFLARRAESPAEAQGVASPLADLSERAVELRVGRRMLCGVFDRLRRRRGELSVEIPYKVQRRWLTLFGGDLIAFGAALATARPGPPDWELSPADARSYLHQRYLENLDRPAQQDLCLIADRSALELATPESVVTPGRLTGALTSGILERREGMISTVHPGIGELIVAAAGATIGDFASGVDLGDSMLTNSALTARRLLRRGSLEAAALQLRRLHAVGTPAFEIIADLGPGSMGERIKVLEILLGRARVVELLSSGEELRRFVVRAPLADLLAFNRLSRKLGAGVRDRLHAELEFKLTAAELDFERYASEILEEPSDLPLRLRHARSLSPKLYKQLLNSLVSAHAFEACLRAVPGFQKRRWSDFLEAAEVCPAAANAIAAALAAEPSLASRLLLHRGKGEERLGAARRVPAIRRQLIAAIRSASHHRLLEEQLLTFGIRKFRCALDLTTRHDPRFLTRLDRRLAVDEEGLASRARAWRSTSKASTNALEITRERMPCLHAALQDHLT